MSEAARFGEAAKPVDEELVNLLRFLLEKAIRGDIGGIAYVTVDNSAEFAFGMAGQAAKDDYLRVLGAIDVLKVRTVNRYVRDGVIG